MAKQWLVLVLTTLASAGITGRYAQAEEMLPDLIAWRNELRAFMDGWTLDLDSTPGRVLLRFNAAIPNIGVGPFEIP